MFQVSPISKSRKDEDFRSWEYGDVDEAVTYARIIKDGVIVDEELLEQVVSWSMKEDRPYTFREVIADQMRRGIIENERLDKTAMGMPPKERAIRSYEMSGYMLEKMTLARLKQLSQSNQNLTLHTGEEIPIEKAIDAVKRIDNQLRWDIMRSQVVTIESQMAMIHADRFRLPEKDSMKE
jgi:hypothetical protein